MASLAQQKYSVRAKAQAGSIAKHHQPGSDTYPTRFHPPSDPIGSTPVYRSTLGSMVRSAVKVLTGWSAHCVGTRRQLRGALEELDSHWTASQAMADLLVRRHQIPFRVGHHFAPDLVDHARQHNMRPSNFPCVTARAIHARSVGKSGCNPEVPITEGKYKVLLPKP